MEALVDGPSLDLNKDEDGLGGGDDVSGSAGKNNDQEQKNKAPLATVNVPSSKQRRAPGQNLTDGCHFLDTLATRFDPAAAEAQEEAREQRCNQRASALGALLAQRANQQELHEA